MGNKSSRPDGGQRNESGRRQNTSTEGGGAIPPPNMPQHLADQYNNGPRHRTNAATQASNQPRNNTSTSNPNSNANTNANTSNPAANSKNKGGQGERSVQEGQMVKMLATVEATTVTFDSKTNLLTFYVTSICPSLTYEIHTGVRRYVRNGNVYYMPNKQKHEPSRIAIEGPQESFKVSVSIDTSKLNHREITYNKHYEKQLPCVILLRYRTTEFRKQETEKTEKKKDECNNEGKKDDTNVVSNDNNGEEVIVEHTEHTAVDLDPEPKRRVISQIVTAGGNAYVVENLYGADGDNITTNDPQTGTAHNDSSSGVGGRTTEVMVGSTIVPHDGEDEENGLCVICLTNRKDTAVMPCRHMCMCKECGEQLLKQKPACPVCRAAISTLLHMPSTIH